ncbi:MAG: inorganic phosphate transporter [Hyphomicrobiaceae bacterium]
MNIQTDGPAFDAPRLKKSSLDKDLRKIGYIEDATRSLGRSLFAPGMGLIFLAFAGVLAGVQIGSSPNYAILIVAAVVGGYMALNIGANDVANNVGPAVGSRALSLTGALVIASVFECAGALIAGGDVVRTISKGIIDPALVPTSRMFTLAMLSALMASAVWVNVATYIGAPVSTTHAVVGGVLGAGIVAAGFDVVNWPMMVSIMASWLISPVIGGAVAALFLAFIKANIIYQEDKIAAARRWVPLLVAIMAASFSAYLIMKGMSNLWRPSPSETGLISFAVFIGSWLLLKPLIRRQSEGMENRNQSLRKLFHLPLICSAALLSFAHGANDVANAVGPLAAILHSAETGDVAARVNLPFWVMFIGAVGISTGLFLFGPRLIIMVGEQITKMNPMRAFCVALSAAVTVIVASAFGLPVSSTHIAVGAVFGVGFFREYYTAHSRRRREYVGAKPLPQAAEASNAAADTQALVRRKLVRRSHVSAIVAAWLITVPAAALMAALIYMGLVLAV